MVRRFEGSKSSTEESITVVKLAKSGGCVDRDEGYMTQFRQMQIREYFFGGVKRTLSPHTQLAPFGQISIFKIHEGGSMSLSWPVPPRGVGLLHCGDGTFRRLIHTTRLYNSTRDVGISHARRTGRER